MQKINDLMIQQKYSESKSAQDCWVDNFKVKNLVVKCTKLKNENSWLLKTYMA